MGTQRIQRRHRNPGPFQGAQPRAGLIRKLVLELKAQSEGWRGLGESPEKGMRLF